MPTTTGGDLLGVATLTEWTEEWFDQPYLLFDLEVVNEGTAELSKDDINKVCRHMKMSERDPDTQFYVSTIDLWRELKERIKELNHDLEEFMNGSR